MKRFEVLLIPLMSGFLHLPRIAVQYKDPSLVCEIDYPALGEQIKVFPGLQSGRIFIHN